MNCHPEAAGGAEPKAETPEDAEGSQDAQLRLESEGFNAAWGSLRSFGVLRRSAFGYDASGDSG